MRKPRRCRKRLGTRASSTPYHVCRSSLTTSLGKVASCLCCDTRSIQSPKHTIPLRASFGTGRYLQKIIEAEKEAFNESFPFLLWHEGGIIPVNEALRSHIDTHTKNILKGVRIEIEKSIDNILREEFTWETPDYIVYSGRPHIIKNTLLSDIEKLFANLLKK